MTALCTLLPFPKENPLMKDKISVIRLTGAYLKFQKFLQDAGILPPGRAMAAITDGHQEHSNSSLVKCSSSVNSLSSSVKNTYPQIFSSLMSKALDGFLMTLDHMGTVLFVSDDSGDYIGLTPPQIIGHTIYEVCDDDSQATIKKNLKLSHEDLIEGNQVWRQFCVRMRSAVSAARTQLSSFYRFNMVHVSGFLKVALKANDGPNSRDVVSANNIERYQVIGLVAECHLIESPVIMELTIEHSIFTAVTTMDTKFTSVDTRVKQIVGFQTEDLIGQQLCDFFHPKELNGYEHTKCRKNLMLQGRSISPVYRFITKCGEWIWMQMVVTLLYVPDTKSPYARTMTFRVINKESGDKGGYKIIEHKEKFVMESNSCLPDGIKPHFPQPAGMMSKHFNTNHIIDGLHKTPLSDEAKEAFFHGRNMGVDTYTTGIQPAITEEGAQPLKIFPDYTQNATLKDVFVPSTMNNGKAIPYGPELYMPSIKVPSITPTNNSTTEQSTIAQPLSSVPSSSSAGSIVSVSYKASEYNHEKQFQTSNVSSSDYQSLPNIHSASSETDPLELLSPEQFDNLDFEELVSTLSSPPQIENAPLKKPLNQGKSTFDGITDNLLMENSVNNEAFSDLPVYNQS